MGVFFKNEARPGFLNGFFASRAFSPAQKHLITELVNGCLRNYIFLDAVISKFTNGKKNRPQIQNILRLGVYQIIFLAKIPPYAAVNEAVKMCAALGFYNLKGYVNAVLRRVAAGREAAPASGGAFYAPFFHENSFPDKKRFLSVAYSVPLWIANLWADAYGLDVCAKMCELQQARPYTAVCANGRKVSARGLIERLTAEGAAVSPLPLADMLIIAPDKPLTELKAFADGLFFVIDPSSVLAAQTLDVKSGDAVLDVCAAPGGKSFYLAQKNDVQITACDISQTKIALIESGAKRLGLNVTTEKRDALTFEPRFNGAFDKVVVDAPCSGLGVMRKKPDIKLNKTPAAVKGLASAQKAMLRNAARYVKPGGGLLYGVCALTPDETRGVTKAFLSDAAVCGKFALTSEREIFPGETNDGFYAARFTRYE